MASFSDTQKASSHFHLRQSITGEQACLLDGRHGRGPAANNADHFFTAGQCDGHIADGNGASILGVLVDHLADCR
jgi:hypothetical protein